MQRILSVCRFAAETRAGTLISGSYYRGASDSVEAEPERTAATLGRVVAATVDTVLVTRGG